jgi:5-hydroxyisourate hydrolase
MGRLTTHVLDTMRGVPAAGVHIDVFLLGPNDAYHPLKEVVTNADGRTDRPLLEGEALVAGVYELHFHVADYFRAHEAALPEPPFLDVVPIRFGIADPSRHYHVPLLASPYGYSTYRGS